VPEGAARGADVPEAGELLRQVPPQRAAPWVPEPGGFRRSGVPECRSAGVKSPARDRNGSGSVAPA